MVEGALPLGMPALERLMIPGSDRTHQAASTLLRQGLERLPGEPRILVVELLPGILSLLHRRRPKTSDPMMHQHQGTTPLLRLQVHTGAFQLPAFRRVRHADGPIAHQVLVLSMHLHRHPLAAVGHTMHLHQLSDQVRPRLPGPGGMEAGTMGHGMRMEPLALDVFQERQHSIYSFCIFCFLAFVIFPCFICLYWSQAHAPSMTDLCGRCIHYSGVRGWRGGSDLLY